MKRLLIIIGPNAVGKTTTAKYLVEKLPKTVYVDSDWCRYMNPFLLTDITKEVVKENIYCLLRNYLTCEEIDTIIFTYSWHGGSLKSGGICTSVRKLKKRPGKVLLANLRS